MNRLLDRLEGAKRDFGPPQGAVINELLTSLAAKEFTDAHSLIRFHEALLFFRAYPPSAAVLKKVEAILKPFGQRVSQLQGTDADLSPLDNPEVSGINGTSVTSNFSYAIVCWLAANYPAQLAIDWDWFEEEERFGATMPRFLPLLAEDAMVEAHIPCHDWLRAAKGRVNEVVWLIERFKSLEISDQAKAELYDSLKIHVTWKFGLSAARTRMKLPGRRLFFHDSPLIPRRDVSFAAELAAPPIPVAKLSPAQGEKILAMARETSAVRYRELHGFTFGDSRRVLKANLGRGTDAFVLGVPPENRLPLRAYHAALILKNGVPVGYFEGLSIFERMESGFNLYYTFREGETAWLYARILRLMHQLLGVRVFSIDPYQVGHENEEGIESGAFWFYRKLGFRPVRPELSKLMLSEERRMAGDAGHRTSKSTLRRLAAGHMLWEIRTSESAPAAKWDRFQIRNLGLAVQKRMAREFGGDPQKIRSHSAAFVKRSLQINTGDWSETKKTAFLNLALVLAMIPINEWNVAERQLAARIIRTKHGHDEARYLKLMQNHLRFRDEVIRLGSAEFR
jgi:hypothetical protein